MKTKLFLIGVFTIYFANAQVVFDWENAVDNGDTVSQVVGDVDLILSSEDTSFNLITWGDSKLEGKVSSTFGLANSVTLTFNKAVDVNSIQILNNYGTDYDWTFVPTGGNNSTMIEEVIKGQSEVVFLNWIGVTKIEIIGEIDNLYYTIGDVEIQSSILLSLQENTVFKELKIYPTIFTDFLTISGVELDSNLKIQVISSRGALLNTTSVNNNKVDLSDLSSGVYFLKMTMGGKTAVKKVIKK